MTRLNRNALMVVAGGAALLIFGAMSVALKPPRAMGEAKAKELVRAEVGGSFSERELSLLPGLPQVEMVGKLAPQ